MASWKPMHYFNMLNKNLNCFLLLNQLCHGNQFLVDATSHSTCNKFSYNRHFSTTAAAKKSKPNPPQSFTQNHHHHSITDSHLLRNNRSPPAVPSSGGFLNRSSALIQTRRNMNSKPKFSADNMVWIDCEMTGLDPDKDCILEVACLVTDVHLNVIDSKEIWIHKTEDILQNMNDWCMKSHYESGLVEKVRASSTSTEQADDMLKQFVAQYVPERTAPMIGNSIYMDRMFILREMPKFNSYLHYRIIDISSIKELCKRYNKDAYRNTPPKRLVHRGLEDIEDSLAELKYYKQHFLKIDPKFSEGSAEQKEYPSAVPYC